MFPAIKSALTVGYCDTFHHVEQHVRTEEQRNLQNVIIILLGSSLTYLTVVATERKLVINAYTLTTFNI